MEEFYERKIESFVDLFELAAETAVQLGYEVDHEKIIERSGEVVNEVMDSANESLPGPEHAMERLMLFCAVGIGMLKMCVDIANIVTFGFHLAEIEEEYGFTGE